MHWALLDVSRLLSDTHHAGRVAYNRAMRLVDPMGQPPVHYYPVPEKDHLPPRAMVSRSPLGWFLFLRNVELDDEIPSYGVDWDGWVGYHYPRPDISSEELMKRGELAIRAQLSNQ